MDDKGNKKKLFHIYKLHMSRLTASQLIIQLIVHVYRSCMGDLSIIIVLLWLD